MGDYEELRDEMQYHENEHYNELRKLEAEENASPTLKADRDSWKARAEKAEAELKEAVEEVERQIPCRGIYGCSDCANSLCYYKGGNQPCKPNWRGQEGSK